MKKSGLFCVPTDKTNSSRVNQVDKYKRCVFDHLLKASNLALCPELIVLFEDTKRLLRKVKVYFSVQERKFVRQSLATRSIPYPNLLIKYHKTINKKGKLPTRLVIPAKTFTATFSKIGYLGIKKILDKAKVKYSHVSIIQASDLK